MLNKLIYIISISIIIGCSSKTDYRDIKFIEMSEDNIYLKEHLELCNIKPNSEFCIKSESIGDIQPTREYVISVLKEMNSNFKYSVDDTWHYNDTIYEYLIGDCEDIASTMSKYMIDEGIDKKYLFLAYRKISETEAHVFLAVETSDAGLLHLDYANSGYPIEPQINFHMRLDNAGVYNWVKGNIK